MLARVINFSDRENQIIEWYDNVPEVTLNNLGEQLKSSPLKNQDEEELKKLLEQLNILLAIYPKALDDDTIFKRFELLIEYVNRMNLTLSNCFSYFNEEKYMYLDSSDVKKSIYGIRIVPQSNYKHITITGYDTNLFEEIVSKKELMLKLTEKGLDYIKMTHNDACASYVFTEDVLSYLKPSILTKHLQK